MANNQNENNNTLSAWATGKLAMFGLGLAVGIFLYQSGILSKLTGKLFNRKDEKTPAH